MATKPDDETSDKVLLEMEGNKSYREQLERVTPGGSDPEASHRTWKHRIVSAANLYGDHIVMGIRHFDALMRDQLVAIRANDPDKFRMRPIQGFVDNHGKFLTRKEALVVAQAAGQIRYKHEPEYELYSEDLY